MIETYRAHLIPPAALCTTLYWGERGKQGEIQIRDLEFKSHKIHDIRSIVLGANTSIDSCDLDILWATTENDTYIRAYRLSKIEGLSAEIGPVPIPPLVPPATSLMGCVIVDTIAGRYRYVVDRWYKDIFAATEDSTRNDPPDIVAALHLHWVTQVMALEAVRGGEPI